MDRGEPPPQDIARAAQRVIVVPTGSLVETLPEHDGLRLTIRLLHDLTDVQCELDTSAHSQHSQP